MILLLLFFGSSLYPSFDICQNVALNYKLSKEKSMRNLNAFAFRKVEISYDPVVLIIISLLISHLLDGANDTEIRFFYVYKMKKEMFFYYMSYIYSHIWKMGIIFFSVFFVFINLMLLIHGFVIHFQYMH